VIFCIDKVRVNVRVTRFELDGSGKPAGELTNIREAEVGFRS
jgi:hypothetical protein